MSDFNSFNVSKTLWYKNPADDWNKALPLGNGRIGAMIFSQPIRERLQLNEDSVWSGGFRERNNKCAYENLEKVRQLLREEKISEAEEIVNDLFCGTPPQQRHYMPLGDMFVEHYKEKEADFTYRKLDLENALSTTEYKLSGVTYTREVFISQPAQVLVMNIKASQPESICVRISVDGRDDYYDSNTPVDDNTIMYYGGSGSEDGIRFSSCIKVLCNGGKVHQYGNFLETTNCDEVTIVLGVQTSFRHDDYKGQSEYDVDKACEKTYDELKAEHIADYTSYFDRAQISLTDNSDGNSKLPTDERLELVKKGGLDNKLIEMYHNFGRYLMIAGSREKTLPMNLQGIWNENMWPAWGGKYTININTEMNYWAVENCNLSELHAPLFDHIERMRPHGRVTAKQMYHCNGFLCHHNTDIWGDTAPQDLWLPATVWPMGAAWLCLHIWEHYKFTLDKDFLAEKYETLKEASEFFVGYLIENKNGELVTSPSVSPENTYLTESGTKGSVCEGPSMDSQILYELFTAVAQSGKILGIDKRYGEKVLALRERLPKPQIGKYGQIMEWAVDYDEVEPGHRHISQLFALYPADIISVRKTPELAKAAKATLDRRLSNGGGHTGWSRAWIINHWARLMNGEKVYENVRALLSNSTNPNMFDMHPPFQIDGNFGGTAGITEALIQSENNEIIILPALPEMWNKGSFRGLRARGGFTVSCQWENSKITSCTIVSDKNTVCTIVCNENTRISCETGIIETEYKDGAMSFPAVSGGVYNVLF